MISHYLKIMSHRRRDHEYFDPNLSFLLRHVQFLGNSGHLAHVSLCVRRDLGDRLAHDVRLELHWRKIN